MSNNKKNTPYFTSQDKSLIVPPLSKRRAAVEKIVKAYRQHKRKTSDDVAFDNMLKATPELSIMESDKTRADLSGYKADKSTADVHKALMAAGMTPAYGNIADFLDATLYALEGEFGEAGWSAAAAIPIVGQMVAGRRALKVAKDAGEEMVTLYRGVPAWYKGKMVKYGKFVGGGGSGKKSFWTTSSNKVAKYYADRISRVSDDKVKKLILKGEKSRPTVLEFEVPFSWSKDNLKTLPKKQREGLTYIFNEGIPVEFLKKVHR